MSDPVLSDSDQTYFRLVEIRDTLKVKYAKITELRQIVMRLRAFGISHPKVFSEINDCIRWIANDCTDYEGQLMITEALYLRQLS